MLSVILLSMLMILLPTLVLIRHVICGNIYSYLNMNLTYETLGTGAGRWLIDFKAGKAQPISFDQSNKWCY